MWNLFRDSVLDFDISGCAGFGILILRLDSFKRSRVWHKSYQVKPKPQRVTPKYKTSQLPLPKSRIQTSRSQGSQAPRKQNKKLSKWTKPVGWSDVFSLRGLTFFISFEKKKERTRKNTFSSTYRPISETKIAHVLRCWTTVVLSNSNCLDNFQRSKVLFSASVTPQNKECYTNTKEISHPEPSRGVYFWFPHVHALSQTPKSKRKTLKILLSY